MRQIKPNIVEEEMDGELLAIDDSTGTYVAVSGTGVWLWSLLRAGTDLGPIKSTLDAPAAAEVDAFVAGLENAGLLVDADTEASTAPIEPPDPWSAPQLEVHDDLQDLLLLDPIHEVTDAGWPNMGTTD